MIFHHIFDKMARTTTTIIEALWQCFWPLPPNQGHCHPWRSHARWCCWYERKSMIIGKTFRVLHFPKNKIIQKHVIISFPFSFFSLPVPMPKAGIGIIGESHNRSSDHYNKRWPGGKRDWNSIINQQGYLFYGWVHWVHLQIVKYNPN